MGIVAKTRTVYVTSDDQEFLDYDKATAHELTHKLTLLLSHEGVGSGGHWDREMFIDFLINHRTAIYDILAGKA